MMEIRVKLYATLRRFAPEGTEIGESFPKEFDGTTIADLVDSFGIKKKLAKIIMVNGIRVTSLEHTLNNGDEVVIFPPVGGGSCDRRNDTHT